MASTKKARGKHRLDKYYHLAKGHGYRSRAAFKLIQLNKRHGFLNEARAVLDLCAAPGGWLQVAVKTLPLAARIVGVDLVPIKPVRGAATFVGDITTQQCRDRLRREAGGSLFDVVLHDGAPNIGGAFATELYTQAALVLDATKLAADFLAPGGTFVTKVFRSRDYTALLYAFRQLFTRVDATKPAASRAASAEIFVVCSGYKAPAKIDPRLLDHRVLFQEVTEAPKAMGPDALLKKMGKKERHRGGYEDGTSLLHAPVAAAAFARAKDPMAMLAAATALVLDGPDSERAEPLDEPAASAGSSEEEGPREERAAAAADAAAVRTHAATTPEVRALCADLRVLGRSEFKQLLRWRLRVRKDLLAADKGSRAATEGGPAGEGEGEGAEGGSTGAGAGGEGSGEAREEALLAEMEALRARVAGDAKRERRKQRAAKRKARVRLAEAEQVAGVGEGADDAPPEEALFSLSALRGRAGLAAAADAEAPGALEAVDSGEELVSPRGRDGASGAGSGGSVDGDSDDEAALRYEAMVEEYLEGAYTSYLQRRAARDANRVDRHRKRARLAESDDAANQAADAEADADADAGTWSGEGGSSGEEAGDAVAGGGLLVELDAAQAGVRSRPAAVAQQWFAQAEFQDPDMASSDEEGEAGRRLEERRERARQDAAQAASAPGSDSAVAAGAEEGGDPTGSGSDGGYEELRVGALGASAKPDDDGGLVVLPQEATLDGGDSTDTEAEFEALDTGAKAEVRALARRWLRSRKDQLSMLDAAYNRYTFDDGGAAPRWLRDDEARHMRPAPLASAADVAAERSALRAIDARPLKKVAEAKARKRRRVTQKLAQARAASEAVVDNADISVRSKEKEIGKLYAKAKAAGRDRRAVRKADKKMSRSAREKTRRKGPPLDRRMVADKMKGAAKAKTQGKAGKGRGRKRG